MPPNMAELVLCWMAASVGLAVPLAWEECFPFHQAKRVHLVMVMLLTWLQMLSSRSCVSSSIGL